MFSLLLAVCREGFLQALWHQDRDGFLSVRFQYFEGKIRVVLFYFRAMTDV